MNLGAALPGDMLCPTNPLKTSEKTNELLGGDTSDPSGGSRDGVVPERLEDGVCQDTGFDGVGVGSGFAGTAVGTATADNARAALVARAFFNRGYNTNYAAGWHLVRSAPIFASTVVGGNAPLSLPIRGSLKGQISVRGPLTRAQAEEGSFSSQIIALLGDAAPGDINESALKANIAFGPADGWATTTPQVETNETRSFVRAGEITSEAFNDGPATVVGTGTKLPTATVQPNFAATALCELAAGGQCPQGAVETAVGDFLNAPGGAVTGPIFIQDTRDWFAVHNGSANILFADSHVAAFVDASGDLFLNPGFNRPAGATASFGYNTSDIELPSSEIFSGVFLDQGFLKKLVRLEE